MTNHFHNVFHGFNERVSEDMNAYLTKDITEEEIKEAIFDIGPHRAPGPDGFPAVFYHQHWDVVKEDVIKEIKQFFSEDSFDTRLNHTNICLIPRYILLRVCLSSEPLRCHL